MGMKLCVAYPLWFLLHLRESLSIRCDVLEENNCWGQGVYMGMKICAAYPLWFILHLRDSLSIRCEPMTDIHWLIDNHQWHAILCWWKGVCVCLCVLAVSLRSKTHLSSGWREIWGVGCVLWKCLWARDWKHSGRVQISPRRQREAREEGNRQNDMILLIHPIHPLDLFDPWEMCKNLPE